MTNEQLQAIKARCEAATPGPWEPGTLDYMRVEVYQAPEAPKVNPLRWQRACICREARDQDADFIAYAREDIPALLAEVERLRGECQRQAEYIRIAQDHMSPSALAYLARQNEAQS